MFIPWDESFDEALIKTITYTKFVIQLAMNIAFYTISFVLSWAYQYILSFIRSKLQSWYKNFCQPNKKNLCLLTEKKYIHCLEKKTYLQVLTETTLRAKNNTKTVKGKLLQMQLWVVARILFLRHAKPPGHTLLTASGEKASNFYQIQEKEKERGADTKGRREGPISAMMLLNIYRGRYFTTWLF